MQNSKYLFILYLIIITITHKLLYIFMYMYFLKLTAGGLKPINMEFFLTMVRCTYSLFTVLITMKTEGDS